MGATVRKWGFMLLVTLLTVLALCPALQAATESSSPSTKHKEAVVVERATTIPQNESVEDMLVLGHNVDVRGTVSEILVVFQGDVTLEPSSHTHLVVNIGGRINQKPGAQVDGLYHASLKSPFWGGVAIGGLLAVLTWMGMLAVSVALVVLASLLALAFRSARIPLASTDASVRRLGVIGLLASIATLAVCSLFALTVVGLPVTVVLFLVYLGSGCIGFGIASLWIGRLVWRDSEQVASWRVAMLGAILITAFMNIPVIGLLLFAVVWLIGMGAVLMWARDTFKRRKRNTSRS